MAQLGNSANQKLNGEWGIHVGRSGRNRQLMKRMTSKLRRAEGKRESAGAD